MLLKIFGRGSGAEPGMAGGFGKDGGDAALIGWQAGDFADDQQRRAANAFLLDEEGKLSQRAEDAEFIGARAVLDDRNRGFGRAAGGQKALGDHRRGINAHEDDDRLRRAGERWPVKVRHAAGSRMAGDESQRLGMVTVGERDAGGGGTSEGG